MEVAVVRVARPVPRAARLRRRRRLAGDGLPRCPGAPSLEDRAARRPDRRRRGGRARPTDRRDARRHRRPDRRGGPVRQPGAVRGPAAGALPGHDGACPRRPRDGARGGAGRLPGQPARAPPRRRQPEERARWARRAGAARRRVRHLGRSRVRPRLLRDAPAAEVPVEPRRRPTGSSTATTVSSRPISSRSRGSQPREVEERAAAAGRSAAARSGRREVAGGVPRPGEPGGDAGERPLVAAATGRHRWPVCGAAGPRRCDHHQGPRAQGLGLPWPADRGGGGACGRRLRPGDRTGRSLDGERGSRRATRRRSPPGWARRAGRGGERERPDRRRAGRARRR